MKLFVTMTMAVLAGMAGAETPRTALTALGQGLKMVQEDSNTCQTARQVTARATYPTNPTSKVKAVSTLSFFRQEVTNAPAFENMIHSLAKKTGFVYPDVWKGKNEFRIRAYINESTPGYYYYFIAVARQIAGSKTSPNGYLCVAVLTAK